jgi:acetyl-CoA acetyltransferase
VARQDVQVAQVYDGFSPFVWYWLEALGFCGKGEAHSFTRDGRIQLGGSLPINTFGGNLGEGRLHGFGHVREGALQVMGRAGER